MPNSLNRYSNQHLKVRRSLGPTTEGRIVFQLAVLVEQALLTVPSITQSGVDVSLREDRD